MCQRVPTLVGKAQQRCSQRSRYPQRTCSLNGAAPQELCTTRSLPAHINTNITVLRVAQYCTLLKDTGCTHAGCQGDAVSVESCQAEVCDLHLSSAAQQDITWLQVTVHNGVRVKKVKAL